MGISCLSYIGSEAATEVHPVGINLNAAAMVCALHGSNRASSPPPPHLDVRSQLPVAAVRRWKLH